MTSFFQAIQFDKSKDAFFEALVITVIGSVITGKTSSDTEIKIWFDKTKFPVIVGNVVLVSVNTQGEYYVLDILPSGYFANTGSILEIYDMDMESEWENTEIPVIQNIPTSFYTLYQSLVSMPSKMESSLFVKQNIPLNLMLYKTAGQDFPSIFWAGKIVLLDTPFNIHAVRTIREDFSSFFHIGSAVLINWKIGLRAFYQRMEDTPFVLHTVPWALEHLMCTFFTGKLVFLDGMCNFETTIDAEFELEDFILLLEFAKYDLPNFNTWCIAAGYALPDIPLILMGYYNSLTDGKLVLYTINSCPLFYIWKYGAELTTVFNKPGCLDLLKEDFLL